MNDVTITPTDNGPYLIQGGVALLGGEGNPYQLRDSPRAREHGDS